MCEHPLFSDLPTATAELERVEFAMREREREREREVYEDLEREEVAWSRGAGEERPYN